MTDRIFELIHKEYQRQQETITLIPSENYVSKAVRDAVSSVLMNKYSEGYPGKRYYEGNNVVDDIETFAIERAKELFGVPYVNVQPYSGSPANSEILFAVANPGDTIMGLKLASGGHLTHGHPMVTFSGKFFTSIQFGLTKEARIDYEQMRQLAIQKKPIVIILGTTAYPFILDWKKAREVADAVGAYLVADISHIAGLVIGGVHPSPTPYAHILMTTTHKTLRGPRGAMIMITQEGLQKDPNLPKKIDMAVIPGMQGGPHNNTTAAIAVALQEARSQEFKEHAKQIVTNASMLAKQLLARGIHLVGEGTENHLMLMDFSRESEGKGVLVAKALNASGIVTNFNTVPSDTSPFYPSGVRIGTPAVTTRGMKENEIKQIAAWITQVVTHISDVVLPEDKTERAGFIKEFVSKVSNDPILKTIRSEVEQLCRQFPLP